MSREIKFRAWDKKERDWTKHIYPCFNDVWAITIKPQWEDIIIMQFTGIKDKKGKEVYEGDIVILHDAFERPEYDTSSKTDLIAQVIWYDSGWHIKYNYENKRGYELDYFAKDSDNNPEDFEVIGNIYKNPELLK